MLTLFGIGIAIGAITGIPIGPVNVAVIDAAYRHTLRRAFAVGLGGAIGDFLYSTLGIVGIGPYLQDYPLLPRILYGLSGVVLIIYGAITVRTRPVTAVGAEAAKSPKPSKEMWSGFTVGLALIVLNPAALVTWVVIVGSHLGNVGALDGLAASTGIFIGSFAWFLLVAWLTNHGKRIMGEKAVWIPRVVGVLLIGYGCYSLVRGVSYFWS
ncbi:MAG: LysE family translocator [Deltaproteobacteria bacterium]|nr:LysE family translocator [Deltaproteobacteria bacterium]